MKYYNFIELFNIIIMKMKVRLAALLLKMDAASNRNED